MRRTLSRLAARAVWALVVLWVLAMALAPWWLRALLTPIIGA